MESKGLAMHSPQSPLYGETLACSMAWPTVFLWLWLGHRKMESKGLAMHSHRIPFYGENLACCPHAVYPLDFSGHQHADGLVCSIGFVEDI
jgi:hypothetical protein